MRVCILVTTTYTHDSRVRRTAEALAEQRYDVHVVCCFSSQLPVVRNEKLGPVHVHRVARETRDFLALALSRFRRGRQRPSESQPPKRQPRRSLSPRLLSIIRSLLVPLIVLHRRKQQRRMACVLHDLAPDVVHANDPDTLPAATAAIQSGAALVYDAHELASHRSNTSRWERWLDLRAERRFAPRAAAVITVSPGIAEILENRYGIATTVVRNVPRRMPTASAPFDLRARIGASADERLILHQGLRAPGRGLPQLVRAIALLPHSHLVFLGSEVRGMDQELRAITQDLDIQDRTHFLGSVPSEVLLTVTSQADVGVTLLEDVSLNHRLALPNKLFEYLAAGIPVVGSDLPEIRRVLEESRGGVVCDPSKPASIAAAVERANDPPEASDVPTVESELAKLETCYRRLED